MNSGLMWAALAGGELLLVLFLALLISWFRNRAMRRRDRKAVRALVSQSRKRKEQRMAEIGEFLAKKYALEGEALGYAVRELHKAEMGLIQAFANTYLKRDAKAASSFIMPVEEGMAAYWGLSSGGPVQGEPAEDGGEMDRLRKENQELSAELRVTMDTLSRMLNEYSTVFSKDADLGDIQVIGGETDLAEEQDAESDSGAVPDGDPLPAEAAEHQASDDGAADDASADSTDAVLQGVGDAADGMEGDGGSAAGSDGEPAETPVADATIPSAEQESDALDAEGAGEESLGLRA